MQPPGSFDLLQAGDFQPLQRIGDGLQMLLRQVQIDQGVFQFGVAQQELNRSEVRSVFQQVGGATVPAMS